MKLVPAMIADLETILHHRRQMFREMGGDYEQTLDRFEDASRKYFEQALTDGSYYAILCEVEGQIAGGGGVLTAPWPGSPLNYLARRAWILNVYVEPGCRRRGIARSVTQALIECCRNNGFTRCLCMRANTGVRSMNNLVFAPPTR